MEQSSPINSVEPPAIRSGLFNSSAWSAIGWLIAQQAIVASSTLWITHLIANIQTGSFSYTYLSLFLGSLLLPYFPGAMALIAIAKAKVTANVDYVKNFANVYRGQISEWTNTSQQSTKSSILTGEAPQAISGYFDFLYHLASCGLNVFLNLLVLAFVIEPLLLVSYGIGVFFAFVILKLQKKLKRVITLRAQQGRIKWTSMILKAWDNILLNNTYNFGLWQTKTFQRAKRLIATTVKYEGISQAISIAMAFALLTPTFILILFLPILYSQDLTKLAIMVVALPRLFQVLSYSYELLHVLADIPMQKARLSTVLKLVDQNELKSSHEQGQITQRIQWNKLSIAGQNKTSLSADSLLQALPLQGRYTIRGENGCGKSSLLHLLKIMKGPEAFYLPVRHDLCFHASSKQGSTGQRAYNTLQEISKRLGVSIVLLDEWDANLDSVKCDQVSDIIDELAQTRCVIEVRHK